MCRAVIIKGPFPNNSARSCYLRRLLSSRECHNFLKRKKRMFPWSSPLHENIDSCLSVPTLRFPFSSSYYGWDTKFTSELVPSPLPRWILSPENWRLMKRGKFLANERLGDPQSRWQVFGMHSARWGGEHTKSTKKKNSDICMLDPFFYTCPFVPHRLALTLDTGPFLIG